MDGSELWGIFTITEDRVWNLERRESSVHNGRVCTADSWRVVLSTIEMCYSDKVQCRTERRSRLAMHQSKKTRTSSHRERMKGCSNILITRRCKFGKIIVLRGGISDIATEKARYMQEKLVHQSSGPNEAAR